MIENLPPGPDRIIHMGWSHGLAAWLADRRKTHTSSGSQPSTSMTKPPSTSRAESLAADRATCDPDNRGRYPQPDESSKRVQSGSAPEGSCRPGTSYYAFLDCLIAFADIGRVDIAETLAQRWADILL